MSTPTTSGFKDRKTGTVYELADATAREAAAKAVQFEEQELTSEQQTQARENIGAMGADALPALPTINGTYKLVCTVTNGEPTLTWETQE